MSSLAAVPHCDFSPRQDALDIYKAFKGIGCDKSVVINILAHRDFTQRALIQEEYKGMYAEELAKRLKSELSGNLETAVLLWLHDPAARDATILKEAIHGSPIVDQEAVIEVMCSRTPSQMLDIKQKYHMKFERHLDQDIHSHFSGVLKELLVMQVNTTRPEGEEIDHHMVERDVKTLYKAGEKLPGADEDVFVTIFCTRSNAHLAQVASKYCKAHDKSLEKVIKNETSGSFGFAIMTILKCAVNPHSYFAERLRTSMEGIGTSNLTLIRLVVTRTEIDMQFIKSEYLNMYKKTLEEEIKSETSGHYRDFLLALVG